MKPKQTSVLPVFVILDAVDYKAVIPARRFVPLVKKSKKVEYVLP